MKKLHELTIHKINTKHTIKRQKFKKKKKDKETLEIENYNTFNRF